MPRYFVLLFLTECWHGSAVQRRRFITRFTCRLARLLGIYQASYLVFRLWQKVVDFVRTPPDAPGGQRFPRWLWATAGLDNRDYLRSWIARRYEGGPKIVVLGIGSIGDILQITPVLRALREKFPAAAISFLHRSPAAGMVLRGNRNIDSITVADSYHFRQIKKAVRYEGAADLVVEIEGVSYIVTYTLAPTARRHPDLHAILPEPFFATATAARELWKGRSPVRVYRHRSGSAGNASSSPTKGVTPYHSRPAPLLSPERTMRPEDWTDFHYLDVLGATGNLAIDRYSTLDFFMEPDDAAALDVLAPKKPYVTVQNGVDSDTMKWSRAMGARPTKLLPTTTWAKTVRLLQAGNLAVVQLGTEEEESIEGVDVDLRGCTTLRQAAVILKSAVCHIGIEGGLVHLARAVDVRSVVAFGPTSTAFLGYPRNINLVASDCHSCWWTTSVWYMHCPRGLEQPPCMNAYTADMIAGAALRIFKGGDVERQ